MEYGLIDRIGKLLDTVDRKFALAVGAGVANTALLVIGKLDPPSFVTLAGLTVGAYIAGHSAEAIFARQDANPPNS